MSKYVVFTFDDGRADQYFNAVKIMQQYKMTGTIYITTGFVDDTMKSKTKMFLSSGGYAMTIEQVKDCIMQGIEIGSHSDQHTNKIDDIERSIQKIEGWKYTCQSETMEKIGFASPSSDIWKKNIDNIKNIGGLSYVRTGRQIKRNGYLYSLLFLINQIFRSKRLFWHLNKRYINHEEADKFLVESVAIMSDTPKEHIQYCAERMKQGEVFVLLFHSILYKGQPGYGADKWFYDGKKFESLCDYFSKKDYKIITMEKAVALLKIPGGMRNED